MNDPTVEFNESCAGCVFYKESSVFEGGQPGVGVCRRFPPTGFPMPGPQGGLAYVPVPAPVRATEWCGEFITPEEYGAPLPGEEPPITQ